VPTVGGPLCCDGQHLPAGPRDQKEVEARQDVLVYSTEPLAEDVEVTGPVTLDLFAETSAVDTDFTGKLVDVAPDGTAINLTEGILRARYRESTTGAPKPIKPGEVYEYKIDLWSTSNVFLKGHRIRLEVSSSNFPRFDRNLNTGKDDATDGEMVKATNTVLHDGAHPSALILPVVSGRLQFKQNGCAARLQVDGGGTAVVVAKDAGAEAQAQPGGSSSGLGGNKRVEGAIGMEKTLAGVGNENLHHLAFDGGLQAHTLHLLGGRRDALGLDGFNGKLQAMQHRLAQLLGMAKNHGQSPAQC
jgi:hypothetical protein